MGVAAESARRALQIVVGVFVVFVVEDIALLIVVFISRSAGFKAAAVVLGLTWALTAVLSANDLGLSGAASILNIVRLLVAA